MSPSFFDCTNYDVRHIICSHLWAPVLEYTHSSCRDISRLGFLLCRKQANLELAYYIRKHDIARAKSKKAGITFAPPLHTLAPTILHPPQPRSLTILLPSSSFFFDYSADPKFAKC